MKTLAMADNLKQIKTSFAQHTINLNVSQGMRSIRSVNVQNEFVSQIEWMLVYIIEIKTIINQINKDLFLFYFLIL